LHFQIAEAQAKKTILKAEQAKAGAMKSALSLDETKAMRLR
jgi:hypothetical protein